jgi:hypothetical protein
LTFDSAASLDHPENRMPRSPRTAVSSWLLPIDFALAAGLVAAAAIVFVGAFRYSFSQDDFAGLARALEISAPLTGAWRYLSGQVFFDVMHAIAGLDSRPYHFASLLGHGACSVLLYFWIRRYCARPAAWLGALFFAVHPSAYAELYWISAIGEIYARLFALGALALATLRGRARWLAPVAFALSLLCKESTILFPFVAAAVLWHGAGRAETSDGNRRHIVLALFAVAALYVAVVFVGGAWGGLGTSADPSAPYAFGAGPHVIANLLTYLGWVTNILLPFVNSFSDHVDPEMFLPGALLLAGLLLGMLSPGLRARGWMPALVAAMAMLAPVLFLRNHTYHYYLYTPLTAFAWLLAIVLDRVAGVAASRPRVRERVPAPLRMPAWVLPATGVLSLGIVINSALLVRKVETMPFSLPGLRADGIVDRALVAERVIEGVERGGPYPPGSRLYFWSPARWAPDAPKDAPELYWERNVRAAMQDGLAARVHNPHLVEAKFVRDPLPSRRGDYYAVYDIDGSTRVITAHELDSLLTLEPAGSRPAEPDAEPTRAGG